MKKIALITFFLLWKILCFSQIYLPSVQTGYGQHYNRVLTDSVQHIPSSHDYSVRTNLDSPQIRIINGNLMYRIDGAWYSTASSGGSSGTDSSDFQWRADTIYAKAPPISTFDGMIVVIAATGLSGEFVGKANQIATYVAGSWEYDTAKLNDQVIVREINNTAFYKLVDTGWRFQQYYLPIGRLKIGAQVSIGPDDNQKFIFKTNGVNRMQIAGNGDLALTKLGASYAPGNYLSLQGTGGVVIDNKFITLHVQSPIEFINDSTIGCSTCGSGGGGSGTVTSIATTSPITGGTITSTGTIGITAMDATHDGYVTAGGSANKILHGDGTWKDTTQVVQFSGLTERLPRWSSSTNISYFDSVFTSNTNSSFPRIGFGVNPGGSLVFDSLRSLAWSGAGTTYTRGGIRMFATRDTTGTNFTMGYSSFLNAKGFYLTNSAGSIFINGTQFDASASFFATTGSITTLSSATALINNARCVQINAQSANNTLYVALTGSGALSSGSLPSVEISPNVSPNTGNTYTGAGVRIDPFYGAFASATLNTLDVGYNSAINSGGTFTSIFAVRRDGLVIATKPLSFSGSTPSNTPGTGAGTSPTISITGNDAAGYISIATGTSPTAGGDIVTITFSTALANTPKAILLTAAGANAATEIAKIYVDQSTASSTSWIIKNTSSALTASTTYKFYYTVTQ